MIRRRFAARARRWALSRNRIPDASTNTIPCRSSRISFARASARCPVAAEASRVCKRGERALVRRPAPRRSAGDRAVVPTARSRDHPRRSQAGEHKAAGQTLQTIVHLQRSPRRSDACGPSSSGKCGTRQSASRARGTLAARNHLSTVWRIEAAGIRESALGDSRWATSEAWTGCGGVAPPASWTGRYDGIVIGLPA